MNKAHKCNDDTHNNDKFFNVREIVAAGTDSNIDYSSKNKLYCIHISKLWN